MPEASFQGLLADCVEAPTSFAPLLDELWRAMDRGLYAVSIRAQVKRFNGSLFKDAHVIPLGREEIGELLAAAKANWTEVEPAIFGALLEQALSPADRKKLGAHYTPRAYVERLVTATVIEPLRADWANVLNAVEERRAQGDAETAIAAVCAFHQTLCQTRVLDPACGTGNFLYVSLDLMKRLEAEVLQTLADLGGQEALGLEGHTVDPHQFLGLELNPRAAAIAELVLWIGYLQLHFKTRGGPPGEPILKAFGNINFGRPGGYDAVLTWDGYPVPKVVREGAAPREAYPNPRQPDWPQAEFIVGNPPFISNREMRERLTDGYVDAVKTAYPEYKQAGDLVTLFWLRASAYSNSVRRLGLVSTSRLRMKQNRAVFEKALSRNWRISFALPDHEWFSDEGGAKVRVCFVVLTHESGRARIMYAPDHEQVKSSRRVGNRYEETYVSAINSDLSAGLDVSRTNDLKSNIGLSHAGVKPYSQGFLIDEKTRAFLFDHPADRSTYAPIIMNGHDVGQRWRGYHALDMNSLTEQQIRHSLPRVWAHILEHVKPSRMLERNPRLRSEFWRFEANRIELRSALTCLDRYIVTLENSPRRYFTFLNSNILPDQKLRVVADDDARTLALLSSNIHRTWSVRVGGRAGQANTPVYNTGCFSTFPFPNTNAALLVQLRNVGEDLDAFRKARQAEHPRLTLTQMYNVREAIIAGRTLTPVEERIKAEGLILVLKELHDEIDALTLQAYGWPQGLPDAEIVSRLVALNAERAAEERRGHVRWLRPDYQKARAGVATLGGEQGEAILVRIAESAPAPFPRNLVEQSAAVAAALASASGPLTAQAIAAGWKRDKRTPQRIEAFLAAFVRSGAAYSPDGGGSFATRRAA